MNESLIKKKEILFGNDNKRKEFLVIVDKMDNVIGEEEKEKCHHGSGILHRAFLVMAFNKKNELMLAKRSKTKKLWPHFWDGTVASHIYMGESYESCAKQRLLYEIGTNCKKIEFLFKFLYKTNYINIGSENEICSVYYTKNFNEKDIFINKNEISEFKFSDIQKLKSDTKIYYQNYTPWFLIAFKKWLNLYYSI